MHAGASFFAARDAAQDLLNKLEIHIGDPGNRFLIGSSLPQQLCQPLSDLKVKARAFLALKHVDKDANAFCDEMTSSDDRVLSQLVARDGRILRLVGNHADTQISESSATYDQEYSTPTDDLGWPPNISHRIHNLWLLSLDIEGNLDAWLHPVEVEATDD